MHLLLCPEVDCYPVWVDRDGVKENVDPASLRLSAELIDALDDWRRRWDAGYDPADPLAAGFSSAESGQRFREDGEGLAARLRAELGRDWAVALSVPK